MKSVVYNQDCLEAMAEMPDKAFESSARYLSDIERQPERFANHIAQPKLFTPETPDPEQTNLYEP